MRVRPMVYLDGRIVPAGEAMVSVYDHGLLYGDGVFEGIRVYHGRVFRLEQHIRRLYRSARAIMLDIPLTPSELIDATLATLRAGECTDGYIRLIVTRGVGDLGLDPGKCPKASIIIICDGISLYPAELYERGLEVITCATRRTPPTSLDPSVKSLNYLNNILAKIEVKRAGLLEGIMLNSEGYVAEATGDNVFVVSEGQLLTPPTHCGILVGVTRDAVMELARREGVEVQERVLTPVDLYAADECFLTGTAAEVIAVVKIDGRVIGDGAPGPVTKRLRVAFHALTETEGVPIYPEGAAGSSG